MAEILNVLNFDTPNILALSYLSAAIAASATKANVQNAYGFVVSAFIVIGSGPLAEEFPIASIVAKELTITGSFSFAHQKNELVRQLLGDAFKVMRAADPGTGYAPVDGSFAQIGSTTAINPSQDMTQFLDTTGGSNYWYKFIYYNTVSGDHTDIADSIAIRGGGYGHLVSLSQIINEAGIKSVSEIDMASVSLKRDSAEDEIRGRLASAGYAIPLQTAAGIYYTPPSVVDIARKLAAGLLLSLNFGTTRAGSSTNGKDKVNDARDLLAEIQLNDFILTDPNGQILQKTLLVDGYPDDATTQINPDGKQTNGPMVTMSKVF